MELYVDLGAHSYSIYIENNILKDNRKLYRKKFTPEKKS